MTVRKIIIGVVLALVALVAVAPAQASTSSKLRSLQTQIKSLSRNVDSLRNRVAADERRYTADEKVLGSVVTFINKCYITSGVFNQGHVDDLFTQAIFGPGSAGTFPDIYMQTVNPACVTTTSARTALAVPSNPLGFDASQFGALVPPDKLGR